MDFFVDHLGACIWDQLDLILEDTTQRGIPPQFVPLFRYLEWDGSIDQEDWDRAIELDHHDPADQDPGDQDSFKYTPNKNKTESNQLTELLLYTQLDMAKTQGLSLSNGVEVSEFCSSPDDDSPM